MLQNHSWQQTEWQALLHLGFLMSPLAKWTEVEVFLVWAEAPQYKQREVSAFRQSWNTLVESPKLNNLTT